MKTANSKTAGSTRNARTAASSKADSTSVAEKPKAASRKTKAHTTVTPADLTTHAGQSNPDQELSFKPAICEKTSLPPLELTHERISQRAYEIWLQAGATHGHHNDDWLKAELQLRNELISK